MSKIYPLVPLYEVLTEYKEYIETPEPKIYPKLSVKLYGKGVVLDEPADGTFLRMKKHQIAKSGQVILSEIWGKKGAIGFVPPEGNGALCTSHFFLFDVNYKKLEPKYLQLIFSANFLEEQLNIEAKGTTGYAAVRPKYLLAAKMPLPPLEEQRRIVARVEELVGKVEEVRSLRKKVNQEAQALLDSILHKVFVDEENVWTQLNVGSVAEIIDPNPSHRMPHYSEHGVPFISTVDFEGSESIRKKTAKYVTEETYDEQLKRCAFAIGDILYSRIGTIGQARILTEVWDFALSHVLVVVKPNRDIVLPRFLLWYLRSDSIIAQAANATRSVGVPDLGIKRIREFHIPVPPFPEQHRIVAYLDQLQSKVGAMKHLREEAMTELDALLPSILNKAFKGEL
ncbi:MAG: restriction endonuclease subunit S [Nostoc sp.]|uniref:restriction endonuclease subunit S n=1 Tax=Nostoc sp. TaxID=1180 RepID=UPI002FFB229F